MSGDLLPEEPRVLEYRLADIELIKSLGKNRMAIDESYVVHTQVRCRRVVGVARVVDRDDLESDIGCLYCAAGWHEQTTVSDLEDGMRIHTANMARRYRRQEAEEVRDLRRQVKELEREAKERPVPKAKSKGNAKKAARKQRDQLLGVIAVLVLVLVAMAKQLQGSTLVGLAAVLVAGLWAGVLIGRSSAS